jgi:hypothetical protein
MKYLYVTNAIQLQLYHYQLYIHQYAIKVVTTTYWHMTWWLMKISGLDRGLLRLESNMHILLRIFCHNNGMEFMFSIFWTLLKVLINVIFASNTYKFCLIVMVTSCLYYVCML